jgi:hypothetical protein
MPIRVREPTDPPRSRVGRHRAEFPRDIARPGGYSPRQRDLRLSFPTIFAIKNKGTL